MNTESSNIFRWYNNTLLALVENGLENINNRPVQSAFANSAETILDYHDYYE